MKTNRFKTKINKIIYRKTGIMVSQLAAMGFIIVAFAILILPVVNVLTIQITVPETSENVQVKLISESISYTAYISRQNMQPNIAGNIDVNVNVKNNLNNIVFNQTYYLAKETFLIRTSSIIGSGYTVTISIPKINYQRSIPFE